MGADCSKNVTSEANSWPGLVRAEQYDDAVNRAFYRGAVARLLEKAPGLSGSGLDLGCGTGLLSLELSRHFRSVVALDISEPMLAIARSKRSAPNIDYRLCDADDFSAGTGFDAIVSHTMFHHLPNLPATLARLKRILAPKGRLIALDCVTHIPVFFPRWSILYRAHAAMQFWPDILRFGPKAACTLLQFRACRAWIAHLKSDKYFSPAQFKEAYAASLPGAQFTRMKNFMGVVWTAPAG